VQSRIKELEKIERIELPVEEKTIHFSFPQPRPSGRMVAEFVNVDKSYQVPGAASKPVLQNVSFVIERGDRIALVGANGAGKSTLIKLLSGREPLSRGEYRLGHNVEVDYFAQDQYKELDGEARVLDDIGTISGSGTQTELRSLLGCFLFSEDDAYKRIGVLSGGERNRYALARMLMRPSNFLLLDEPTNHLDLRAKDVLLQSLSEFTGTVVFVSHDRYFIDKLATRIFEISGGQVKIFPGNYEDYNWRKQQGQAPTETSHPPATVTPAPAQQGNGHAPPQNAEASRRINPIKKRQMQERCEELEELVARLEVQIGENEKAQAVFVSAGETARLTAEIEKTRRELDERIEEWEQLSQMLESAEA
ncbi:MAG TPA: ATP-binding cassette domain-containing protein, partial [Terriglobales bacterium]|nr:ATP-binding cassette domain-containing protein [Terriglobales bacterium]